VDSVVERNVLEMRLIHTKAVQATKAMRMARPVLFMVEGSGGSAALGLDTDLGTNLDIGLGIRNERRGTNRAVDQNNVGASSKAGVRANPDQGSLSMNDHERRWIEVGPFASSAIRCLGRG